MPGQTKSVSVQGQTGDRWAVLLPLPLDNAFDYAPPPGVELSLGDFVRVPFGKRDLVGVVWGVGEGAIQADKLRSVGERLDLPPLPAVSREFVEWVAGYYMAARGSVLRMAMSVRDAFKPEKLLTVMTRGTADPSEVSPARRRALDILIDAPSLTGAELAKMAGVSPGVIRQMVKAGQLREIAVPREVSVVKPDPDHAPALLSPAQSQARDALCNEISSLSRPRVTLLDGVTGSGKTEVYFEAIAECLRHDRQALVLLPEIALTHQWLDRFQARFGAMPAQWHSDLTGVERRRTWRAVLAGEARVVVGARSALFLPFRDLGLTIVDEEHESAFKQEDGVSYQARDMAVVRGHLARIPVILSSATPSLETMQNVASGKYARQELPQRHGGAIMPSVELIDLRRDKPLPGRWLSPRLVEGMKDAFANGEQTLLFLNRRGYAPLTLCRHCGHRWQCPNCTSWLVEHRYVGRLQCHHCGYQTALPNVCVACGAEGEIAACGPGVERLNEEVAALLPEARRLILTSDTANSPAKAADMFRRIAEREVDIVLGTQIVAKGHHFPALTLVGVVDADLGLSGGDLRAAERTFQLLHQVSGRAGRAELPGRVLIQTYDATRPVMLALATGNRDRFMAQEAQDREAAGMPPFGRLAALVLSGSDADSLDRWCRGIARQAPRSEGVTILGPAPAPLALLKGRHRRRFLVKARKDIALQPLLRQWLAGSKAVADQALDIDIDPYSFL